MKTELARRCYYMHQWAYKDEQVRAMFMEQQDRQEVVRVAIEAFGGHLQQFYFCFGEFDGVAISDYPDNETAVASLMSIFGQGRLRAVKTTVLISPDEMIKAIQLTRKTILDKKQE